MKSDDEMTKVLKDFGVELPEGGFSEAAGSFGSLAAIRGVWRRLWSPVADDDEDDLRSLRQPYHGPVPVVVNDSLVPDPFIFTLEFDRSPLPSLVNDLSANIAEIAKRYATDDAGGDDHVSGWSSASAVAGQPGRPVQIRWHLDVASASPGRVRKVIEETAAYAATIRPIPIRLVIGDPD